MRELDQNRPEPAKALEELGQAYVKVPRSCIRALFYGTEENRLIARFYLSLYCYCAFHESVISYGKINTLRKKGQWVGTTDQLAALNQMTLSQARLMLRRLEEKGRIQVEKIYRGIRVTVVGYAEYTATEEKAPRETLQERYAREYREMEEKLNQGRYV